MPEACRGVPNPGNRAPASLASTSLEGPKADGSHSGTMLFILLFLNKSEVSGGTNEVIGKDMRGRAPGQQAEESPRDQDLAKLRWTYLSCALRAQGWDQGAGQAGPRGLCSLFPRCRWGAGVQAILNDPTSHVQWWEGSSPLWKEAQFTSHQEEQWMACAHGGRGGWDTHLPESWCSPGKGTCHTSHLKGKEGEAGRS